jgi:hypothetical protein
MATWATPAHTRRLLELKSDFMPLPRLQRRFDGDGCPLLWLRTDCWSNESLKFRLAAAEDVNPTRWD